MKTTIFVLTSIVCSLLLTPALSQSSNKTWDKKTLKIISEMCFPKEDVLAEKIKEYSNLSKHPLSYIEEAILKEYDTSYVVEARILQLFGSDTLKLLLGLSALCHDSVMYKSTLKIMEKYDPYHLIKLRKTKPWQRTSYTPCFFQKNSGTIYLSNKDRDGLLSADLGDLLAELSHHVQFTSFRSQSFRKGFIEWKRTLIRSVGSFKRPIVIYQELYDDSSSFEYEAHSIIEPRLIRELNNYYLTLCCCDLSKHTNNLSGVYIRITLNEFTEKFNRLNQKYKRIDEEINRLNRQIEKQKIMDSVAD